jgi:glc operon protein GlcG
MAIPGCAPSSFRTGTNRFADNLAFKERTTLRGAIMQLRSLKLLAALIAALCSITASAQAPAPATPTPPLPYGPPIGAENAKKAAAAALAEARKNNWLMAVAVVEPSGVLVYYEKMDNTQIGSTTVSIDKARTSALFKRPTKAFQDLVAAGGPGLRILTLPNAIAIEGGVPIVVNGQVIGAISVSGDAASNDAICAQAGAVAVK